MFINSNYFHNFYGSVENTFNTIAATIPDDGYFPEKYLAKDSERAKNQKTVRQ